MAPVKWMKMKWSIDIYTSLTYMVSEIYIYLIQK